LANRILVTGGAGFVGSHLVEALLARGYEVRVYDALVGQVHGEEASSPRYLPDGVEFIHADVRDRGQLKQALEGIELISHQAADVGVAQSMYEVHRYVECNSLGTANLLDVLANEKHSVRRLVVASSMTIYGEGAYDCEECGVVYPSIRPADQLRARDWEPKCPSCGKNVGPAGTSEDKPLCPTSVYAITKRDQEELCLTIGRAYGIPTVALRYFNIYGPRQSLSNPYAGVPAIFSSRLLNGSPPVVYEDGLQSRDFIHVKDIVQANILALENSSADFQSLNVASGKSWTILDIAKLLIEKLGYDGEPQVTGEYRQGDIRHCASDISKIQSVLGFEPKVSFEDGIDDLTGWVKQQQAADLFEEARQKLVARGLTE